MLAPIALVPSLLFESLVRMRNGLYSAALLPQRRLERPVISVGNITLGGAGKTPFVIYTAQTLLKLGITPVVLSRGYGRRLPNELHILPPGSELAFPASKLGDEPALIRRRAPDAWMGISKDRFAVGSKISQRQTRMVFILDDGFQHRRLQRNLDIVIIDRSQPLKSNRIFPRGTLREPLSGLRRCHVIVLNGRHEEGLNDPLEADIRNLHPDAKIFHCEQKIESMIPFSSWKETGGQSAPARNVGSAYLVAALGNPERFRQDVLRLGIEVRGTRFFADHFKLKHKDWLDCSDEANRRAADAMITTEKDAIKISRPPDFPLLVSVQSTEMSESEAFELVLKDSLQEQL